METVPANPFKGLRPYSQKDRDRLFGRDRDLILMKDRIFSGRTTLLFAGSGVGKTSFLNAKVIPELKKQCVVVWHNRWTGAEEIQDGAEAYNDKIRLWPPRVLMREVIRKLRSLGANDLSVSPLPSDPLAQTDDAFELQVRQIISQNLRRAGTEPRQRLSEALACFSKSANPAATNRCVLILDQFEEVFQYHAYEDYFRDFVKDLCNVINNDDYQVRIIFSMREEFLGELSVFDNRIPDLFSNYYRLRYPDKEEAEDIIRRTSQLSGIDPDEDKLPGLVEDLSKIAKGAGSFAERSTNKSETGVHVIKRDFVAPPYLQIACERLWNKQYATNGSSNGLQTTITGKLQSGSRFLHGYHAGADGAGATGGDAQQAVVSFCEEKLSRPFLSRTEQDIVARAFSFLVTKQGAKMAYELTSLADHMQERIRPLKTALEKLSQDQAKILRESRGPDRSYWFELYHDMYATIVDDWKVRYLAQKRRRYLIKTGFAVLILLFAILAYYWLVQPQANRRQLLAFKDQVCSPGEQAGYAEAVSNFGNLSNTWGYRRTANSLWAQILERRAQCFEKNNDPNSAILTLLKAATMEHDEKARRRMATAAASLMGAPNGSLIATYCDDCDTATLSPDGKWVLSVNLDGHVRLWDADTGQPRGQPFCPDCRQSRPAARKAIFSSDGRQVLTVAGVRRCGEGSDTETTNETGLQIQLWDRDTRDPILTKPLCLIDKGAAETRTTTGPTFGKESGQDKPGGAPPTIDIRAVAKAGENFWIAGLRGNEIHVWDKQGGERTIGAGRNPGSVGVTFSPDGLYLAGLFAGESIRLWRVSETQITPYPFKNSLAIAFGAQHQLLSAEKGNIVKLIDLDSGRTRVSVNSAADLPAGAELQNIGFSPNGEQFVTRLRTEEGDVMRAWHATDGQPSSAPLHLSDHLTRSGLSEDGRAVLVIADGDPPVIEKWDLQTGQLVAGLKRKFDAATFRPDRQSVMVFAGTTARLWAINDDSGPGRILRAQSIDPYELTADGKTLITINDSSYLQYWNADTGRPSSEAIPLGAQSRLATISADGNYAAADTEDGRVRVWQTAGREPVATFSVEGEAQTMALSADGNFLARGGSDQVRIWDLARKTQIDLRGHTGNIVDVAVSNQIVITASADKTARLWSTLTGQLLHVLSHEDVVSAVAISRDGNQVMTGSGDGTIRLWEVKNGARLGEIRVKDSIRSIKFSSDGSTAAILTPYWLYLARIENGVLTYQSGILIADPWSPAFSLSPDGKKLRFAYVFGANAAQLQDLDLEPDGVVEQLARNPEQALNEWQKKLGSRVGDLGRIGKLWEEEQFTDAGQTSPAKQAGQ